MAAALEVTKRARGWNDGAAEKLMLKFFAASDDAALVTRFRAAFANTVFN